MKYVYRIKHKPTGYFYYGAKYAKNADPSTFWKDYFTSSARVSKLVEEYGADTFETKIVKAGFKTNDECLTYEAKLILKTFKHEKSLNYRHSLGYCGVDDASVKKMLNSRNKNGSYITGAAKRLETIGDNIQEIVAKTAETRRTRGDFEKLSQRIKENGIGYLHTCPHCGKSVKGGNYNRWHGDNCKNNPNITEEMLQERNKCNQGRSMTEESKEKLSKANKCMVTCYDINEKCNKKVTKEEFDKSPHLKGMGSKGTPSYKQREPHNKGKKINKNLIS